MATRTANQAIEDADSGGKLVVAAAWGLVGVARRTGGDGAGAIVASGLELAADAATAGSEVLRGIAKGISEIDPRSQSAGTINAYLMWAGAASMAAVSVVNGAAQGVIRAADFLSAAAPEQRDIPGATADARQGGLRLLRAGETIAQLVADGLSK